MGLLEELIASGVVSVTPQANRAPFVQSHCVNFVRT